MLKASAQYKYVKYKEKYKLLKKIRSQMAGAAEGPSAGTLPVRRAALRQAEIAHKNAENKVSQAREAVVQAKESGPLDEDLRLQTQRIRNAEVSLAKAVVDATVAKYNHLAAKAEALSATVSVLEERAAKDEKNIAALNAVKMEYLEVERLATEAALARFNAAKIETQEASRLLRLAQAANSPDVAVLAIRVGDADLELVEAKKIYDKRSRAAAPNVVVSLRVAKPSTKIEEANARVLAAETEVARVYKLLRKAEAENSPTVKELRLQAGNAEIEYEDAKKKHAQLLKAVGPSPAEIATALERVNKAETQYNAVLESFIKAKEEKSPAVDALKASALNAHQENAAAWEAYRKLLRDASIAEQVVRK